MRHVVSTGMVPHLWARQSQDWARNPQRNISFQGRVLRSYATPIARITDWQAFGRTIVLLDSEKYSVTTSRHQREAASALSSSEYYRLHVPVIQPATGTHHKLNSEALFDFYHELKHHWLNTRGHVWADGQSVEEKLSYMVEQLQLRLDKFNVYNKYVWKRKGYREFLVTEDLKESLTGIAARSVKWYEEQAKRDAIRQERMRVEERERLIKWLEGDTTVWLRSYAIDGVYLRMLKREDGNLIQTSMGAEIPEGHGQRLWAFIEMLRDRGETYEHNGHSIHVGAFRVDRIDADYTLHAGCHHIPYARMAEFAIKHWGA